MTYKEATQMKEILNVGNTMFSVEGVLTPEVRAYVLQYLQGMAMQDRTLKMSPATCPSSVVQGTTHTVTINASGGTPPYTYTLLLDGVPKASFGPTTNLTWSQNVTFTEAVGSHTLVGQVVDTCGTPQTATDPCSSFNITALVTTGSILCTSTPTGAQILLDGTNTGYVTPATLTNVGEGSHTMTYRMTGYNDCSQEVIVIAGSTISSSCTLIPSCQTLLCSFTMI